MVHIVIAHYKEDTEWVKNLKYPYTIISKQQYKEDEVPNKGYEASSFLEYIINNYDCLDDYTIFVHGHRNSWHHNEFMDSKINRLIFVHDYYNINDQDLVALTQFPGSLEKTVENIHNLESILGYKIDCTKIIYRCSSQFYVSRETIHKYTKEQYQKMLNWLYTTDEKSFWTSRVFEYCWHVMFTCNYIDIQ